MAKARICPNCYASPVKGHPENGCVLAAFIVVLRDRGNKPERRLLQIHAECNVDALWDQVGPLLDRLEEGEFS